MLYLEKYSIPVSIRCLEGVETGGTKMLEIEAKNTGKVLVIGHRGALGYAPENTMSSFKRGLEIGCDLIELDVHMSADERIVVMHDADVSRTTDGRGHLKDMELAAIKKLDAGVRFDERFRGERVPTLDEVLDWARTRVGLVIEIKGDPQPTEGIETQIIALIKHYGMMDAVMLISFYHEAVRRVKELEPRLATGILYSGQLVDTLAAAQAARADSVRPHWYYWTAQLVQQVHNAGLTASTWVANDEKVMKHLVEMGIDSIGCDYPDRLCGFLDRNGLRWGSR
jgi:glycerophosphoryl diester phosphodiesterase